MKTIKWYRKNQYGVDREFVLDEADAKLICFLRGGKITVDAATRRALSELAGVEWQEVLAPK